MKSGLRFRDEFYRQITYACVAAYIVVFWGGFVAGALAIAAAVWP